MNNNQTIPVELLNDYLTGKLEPNQMHEIERRALDDSFLDQALDGLRHSTNSTQTLSLLQKKVRERIAQAPQKRKTWHFTTQRLSIAATAAVLLIAITMLFWLRTNLRQEQAKLSTPGEVEVEIKPTETGVKTPNQVVDHNSGQNTNEQSKASSHQENNQYAIAPHETAPEPTDGWLKYNQYLDANNRFRGDGEKMVELGFEITSDGNPRKIEILNSQSEQLNNEAVRLLSEGPKWKHQANGKNKATLVIKF